MRTIHKYVFDDYVAARFDMPAGAQVLCVQEQHANPCIWALVETDRPLVPRKFRIFGTGHELPEQCSFDWYVGTWQSDGGRLVWHLFEVTE